MSRFLRFLRYCADYLVFYPARFLLQPLANPLFHTILFVIVCVLSIGSLSAGGLATAIVADAPDSTAASLGTLLDSTMALWVASLLLIASLLAVALSVLIFFGSFRGLFRGIWIVKKAWKIKPLEPIANEAPIQTLVACHLTDLHQCREERLPYEIEQDSGVWPAHFTTIDGQEIGRRIGELFQSAAATNTPALVITGDVTDSGAADEWESLARRFYFAEKAPSRFMAPGNHDINFNPASQPDYFLRKRKERGENFEAATKRFCRAPVEYPHLGKIEADGFTVQVLVLDSIMYRSDNLLSNAVGAFGKRQIADVQRLLAQLSGHLLVLCHHHLGGMAAKRPNFEELLMNALDAPELLSVIDDYASKRQDNHVLVLHGHKHVRSFGQYGRNGVRVFGLPSSTLGQQDRAGTFDGIGRFAKVGIASDGSWAIEVREVRFPPRSVMVSSHSHNRDVTVVQ